MDLSEDDFSCPLCCEVYKDPVILSCGHSVCKECLQRFFKTKESQECPFCRSGSSHEPLCNLALKNLCAAFMKLRNERRSSEDNCGLHDEKLQVYCLEDKQQLCVMCVTSKQHDKHTFRPVGEVVSSHKEELNTALKSLKRTLKCYKKDVKGEFEKAVQHITAQAEHTERVIKHVFEKLHQFLQDEEEATITALKEEEEQKKEMMKEKLEEINNHISALSHTIKDKEKMLKASDISFLKEFPVLMERVQLSQPDPEMPSGALINVSHYLGNLPFRIWKKMQDVIHYTPVILDPNTASQHLILSDDLSGVRFSDSEQLVPNNPERFDYFECVLGSEGFTSGTHCWDVEVDESLYWSVGVTTASNQRKRDDVFDADVWSVQYGYSDCSLSEFPVKQKLKLVRVELDYERGSCE